MKYAWTAAGIVVFLYICYGLLTLGGLLKMM